MIQNLLAPSSQFDDSIPFPGIQDEDFEEAFEVAIEEAKASFEALRADTQAPTFENVLGRLDRLTPKLDRVQHVFSNLLHARTSEKLQETARIVMPKIAAFVSQIYLDALLFSRVNAVWESRKHLKLEPEASRLLELTYLSFIRNGAKLKEEEKSKIRAIDERLAILGQEISEKVLLSTKEYNLWITDPKDLIGLPERSIQAAKEEAVSKGKKDAWCFTLDRPSFLPFLQFSEKRELRETLWRAQATKSTEGKFDTRSLILETARLRLERANILGYETHAHYVLEERMAGTPSNVMKFTDRLFGAARQTAEKEWKELLAFSGQNELKPWDVAFYSEKLRKKRYDFDEEALRPYFELGKTLDGVFEVASRLYGIGFQERSDVSVYHPDVKVFEVRDEKNGTHTHLGLFYVDFYPRESKQGGAWCTTFRYQYLENEKDIRPHVSIVCNFTKPTDTSPSLLNIEEVRTLFHEFGHALHHLLSRCRYQTLSGTNVFWDFVELPSQIMENWVKEEEALGLFARHYQTGEPLPKDWIRKIKETSRFHAGMNSMRQLSLGALDLAWHTKPLPSSTNEVEEFETSAMKKYSLLPHIPGTMISPSFTHIFAGGYSAGYYGYKWAEALDADAFEFFLSEGLFSKTVTDSFRTQILEKGGSEHPAELYRRFRGRDPDPDALLRRDGLLA